MSNDPGAPDWLVKLRAMVHKLTTVLNVQASLGRMFQGDMATSRKALETLSVEDLQGVSLAASAVANLADEVAREKIVREYGGA